MLQQKVDAHGASSFAPGDTQHARRCYLEDPSSAPLLVVFSGHFPDAAKQGYEVPFEFSRFLARHPLGAHVLFLRDPNMSWYLRGIEGLGPSVETVAEFIDQERKSLGASCLWTLGSSMGGYAAILYGHLLKADIAVAFGPQVYLDQATRRSLGVKPYSYEVSLAQVEQWVLEHGTQRLLKLTSLLPLDIGQVDIHVGQNEAGDINQARGLNDQPNVKFVVWPGGNHMVVRSLRDAGRLLPALRKSFRIDVIAEGNEAVGAAEVLRARGNALVREERFQEAEAVYSEALQACTGPSHHLVLANRSLCLLKLGRYEEAWQDADAAIRLEPTYAKALFRRAVCEEKRGYLASALRSAAQARQLDDGDVAVRALEARLQARVAAEPGGPAESAPFAAYCE